MYREYNFDGIVGSTHSYAGLSPGNLAATSSAGDISNPREAALQGLEKMRIVSALGAGQAVLPPHPRPSLTILRRLGFSGNDEHVLASAASTNSRLFKLCSSSSAMWTANAATCAPSSDTTDRRAHFVPANLQAMFHRSIEAETTFSVLRAIFADADRFVVHEPLPGGGQFGDEGAANHLRLQADNDPAVHLFAWGREHYWEDVHSKRDYRTFECRARQPHKHPARQTKEASEALARLSHLPVDRCLLVQQEPNGIDAGAFHTDVLAVAHRHFLMLHERAFADPQAVLTALERLLGPQFTAVMASERELPIDVAVGAYPFNSQVLTTSTGTMAIVAPIESQQQPAASLFLERVVAGDNPVTEIHYLNLRQSMKNGGGPACLRLRVTLSPDEVAAIKPRVFYTADLHDDLARWVQRHYRDRLAPNDLADPVLIRESLTALDELTELLRLGSIYDFQTSPG